MDSFSTEADELKAFARLKPNPERLAKVQLSLNSKWEGIQSLALQVLASWGGRDAIRLARTFLLGSFDRQFGWSIRGVAVRTLSQVIGPDDVDWVLDLYFSRPSVLAKHELLPIVVKLDPDRARERLVAELASRDPLNRQAALKAIGNMPFADRQTLIGSLREDPDKEVRVGARLLSAHTKPS